MHAYEDGGEIGVAPAATSYVPVVTAPLHKDRWVTAQQFGCEGTDHQVDGLLSDPPVKVRPTPLPVPPPGIDGPSLIPGNDVVTLTGLLVGSEIQVTRGGVVLGAGLANAGTNAVPLSTKLTGEKISATQKLCEHISVPTEATPEGRLDAPYVVGPICDHARHVVVRKTTINAIVVVQRKGIPVGYAGAAPGDVVVELGSGINLSSGDHITAIQYLGSPGAWTISPTSNTVEVVRRVESPAVEILGGHPFFLPKGEEQPIPGPVFPRGAGAGPQIRIQACCQGSVDVHILDPGGQVIAEPVVTEIYPGYYSAAWPWTSSTGWAVPDGIPVGQYTVSVRASCVPQQEAKAPFFIVFDPAAVGGPSRFTFDATAIWFGTGLNSAAAFPYYLHPSDARVFMPAVNAAQGHIDPYAAAHALARAEEALFAYDLNWHGNDVVHLITSESKAQCADDACCLTAFLRAMGIPAHPVTVDSSPEHPHPDLDPKKLWGFDTWVEFLSHHDGALEWRVLHPHELPGMTAESRRTFGTTRNVAIKKYNDIIIMGGENWVPGEVDDGSTDVSYGRNACREPSQALVKAAWVEELCEAGYWEQTHWDCAGVRTRALAPSRLSLDGRELRFGGVLSGTLHLENHGEEALQGPVRVELIGTRPEVKRLAETTYAEVNLEAAIAPGESIDLSVRLDLPTTLPPGQSLLLQARMVTAEATLPAALQQVSLPVGVEAGLGWEARGLVVGEPSTARVVIRNISDEPIRDVTADMTAPFAIRVEETQRRLGDLEPGDEREIEWTLWTVAPIDAGSLHVAVATGNSGSVLIQRPFRVAEPVDVPRVQVAAPLPEHGIDKEPYRK
ncbi:transglutaminase domain-containing protein [Actinomadura sp. 3N407]|uniref:transglutaminase domain-containing protein n=1 Tax=Actinomadura sp. 3N407 TaxID=3457423 RepID=UPI003FCC4190